MSNGVVFSIIQCWPYDLPGMDDPMEGPPCPQPDLHEALAAGGRHRGRQGGRLRLHAQPLDTAKVNFYKNGYFFMSSHGDK